MINENKKIPSITDGEIIYGGDYAMEKGCLCKVQTSKDGDIYVKLCNFAPKIVTELTIDDGKELKRKYIIGGTDEHGKELPEVEVEATKLEKMEWLSNNWDASLDLEIVPMVERHMRHALKSTAKYAEKKTIFTHTGWKEIDGKWEFLMPKGSNYDVQLQGKQKSYFMDPQINDEDFGLVHSLLNMDLIPNELSYPCLALVFLSPLNEFLKQTGHEPKFILTLLGRTGSMKSTLAALMTSFYGNFSATDLPMSFRDTANSIIFNSFALKDVLTCVDDYHPTGRKDSENMKEIMQTIARGYGDRAARNRLTPDITLRETRPPQGNVIVTAEFAPDIGESGTARLFFVEMKPFKMDLQYLTTLQECAAKGDFTHIIYAYTNWIKERYLSSNESIQNFLDSLSSDFQNYREYWRQKLKEKDVKFHNRIPDTLAELQIGFESLVQFLFESQIISEDLKAEFENKFDRIMFDHATKQSLAVEQDKPTHIFIRKLSAMLDCGQISVAPFCDKASVLPSSCIGYEDENYYYLFFEATHKAVKKFCDDQGEGFAISSKALCKALAEEEFINVDGGQNTKSIRFGNRTKRVMLLSKSAMEKVLGA